MLDAKDIAERIGVTDVEVCYMSARRMAPEPILVGDRYLWREEDVELFVDYLRARHDYRDRGLNPDDTDGPAPPVYSTGFETFDPREAAARIRERERQAKSKTLRAGSKPIPAEKPVTIPDVADTTAKVKG